MFENVLNDIVAVLVLEELISVGMEFLQDWTSLIGQAVLKDPLDDSTTIRMG